MGRRRSRQMKNLGLEPNLYRDSKGFIYRNPNTGKRTRVNRSLDEANALARQANSRLMTAAQHSLLAKMTTSVESTLFSDVCDRFVAEILNNNKNKQTTRSAKINKIEVMKTEFGLIPIQNLTVKLLSDFLDKFVNNARRKVRDLLIDIFTFAKAVGLYEGENIAAVTLMREPEKKKRQRHTWEGLQKIIAVSEPWLQRAIKIALYTLQRRADLVSIRKDQVDLENGFLFLHQIKTEGEQFDKPIYLKIKMGEELLAVVQECMASPIASPYLLHYRPRKLKTTTRNAKPHWSYIMPDYISKQFLKAVKKSNAYPEYSGGEIPTLHEVRALGSWLYEHRGGFSHDYVQQLMGHSSAAMTEKYQDGHEIIYQDVEAGLSLEDLAV